MDIGDITENIYSVITFIRRCRLHDVKKYVEYKNSLAEQEICPKCYGKLIKRTGKNGEFYGCSNYPKCKYTKNISNNKYYENL